MTIGVHDAVGGSFDPNHHVFQVRNLGHIQFCSLIGCCCQQQADSAADAQVWIKPAVMMWDLESFFGHETKHNLCMYFQYLHIVNTSACWLRLLQKYIVKPVGKFIRQCRASSCKPGREHRNYCWVETRNNQPQYVVWDKLICNFTGSIFHIFAPHRHSSSLSPPCSFPPNNLIHFRPYCIFPSVQWALGCSPRTSHPFLPCFSSVFLCFLVSSQHLSLSAFCPLLFLYVLCGLSLSLPNEPCPILFPISPSLFRLSDTLFLSLSRLLPLHPLFSPHSFFFSHQLTFLPISLQHVFLHYSRFFLTQSLGYLHSSLFLLL